MTAWDVLLLAVAAPGSDRLLRGRPASARTWDRHATDAIRALFGAEPLFASSTTIRRDVRKRRRC